MNPLKHTSIIVKACVLMLLTFLPLGNLMYDLIKDKNALIQFSQSEYDGDQIVALARDVVLNTADARSKALNGKVETRGIQDSFESLKKAGSNSPYVTPATLQATEEIIKTSLSGRDHDDAINQLLVLIGEVADKSNLTLDPDVDTYYLMDAVTVKLPGLVKVLSEMHSVASAAVTAGALTSDQRIQLFVLKGSYLDAAGALATGRDKSFAGTADNQLKPNSEAAYKTALEESASFFNHIERDLLAGEYRGSSMAELNSEYEAALHANAALWQKTQSELDRLIQKRIKGFEDRKLNSILVTIVMVSITMIILLLITSSITKPLLRVMKSLEALSKGETEVTVPDLDRRDEMGALARATDLLRKEVAGAFSLKQMVEYMPTSVLMADARNGFKISFANRTAKTTLKSVEHSLPMAVEQIVGQTPEFLSANGEEQRQALAHPENLPRRERTKIGNEVFDITTSAINSRKGDYIGAMITWALATKQAEFADSIEKTVSAAVQEVAGSVTQIGDGAKSLHRVADETKQLSTAVAAASAQAAQTSSQVAASAEELTASISEISSKLQASSRVATEATNKGQAIDQSMKSLAEKAARVSEVVNVITGIAEQTNLLALNATIEAARAGEAGKGFAVVASEVKGLANQTAKATEEVTTQITEMQAATTLAVDSVREIMGILNEISAHTTAVAAAVEEQSAATNEIARNIAQTATGTQEISQNIVSVEQGAEDTGKTSQQVKDTVTALTGQISTLQEKIGEFLKSMRSAA
jgi:methyl-accepting chemotaxis protein